MPTINFYDLNLHFEDKYNDLWLTMVYYKTCSYAFFPKDESLRNDYMKHVFTRMYIYLKSKSSDENYQKTLHQYRESLGDELELLEAPNTASMQKQLKSIFTDGMIIGMAITAIYCLSKTESKKMMATKNRMAYFAYTYGHCSRSKFYNLLNEYSDVAHIWAGIYVESTLVDSPNIKYDSDEFIINDVKYVSSCLLNAKNDDDYWQSRHGQMITNTLIWATEFQKFGTTHYSPRCQKSILNSKNIWKVPEIIEGDLPDLPSLRLDIIKSLKKYRVVPVHK